MFTTLPLLFAVSALAQEPAVPAKDPLVAKIEAKYADVGSMTMAFTQTVKSPLYGEQVQTGTVAFARPGKMRWTFGGEGKHYVSDGSTMWVYLEADKQAFKYSGWDPSGSAESLLSSLDKLDELFVVRSSESSETGHSLKLAPNGQAAYAQVELVLNSDLTVTKVIVTDTMETQTELAFSDSKLGAELPADTFVFAPPDGVEVIEAGFPQ